MPQELKKLSNFRPPSNDKKQVLFCIQILWPFQNALTLFNYFFQFALLAAEKVFKGGNNSREKNTKKEIRYIPWLAV